MTVSCLCKNGYFEIKIYLSVTGFSRRDVEKNENIEDLGAFCVEDLPELEGSENVNNYG